jgi:hypothetical protein
MSDDNGEAEYEVGYGKPPRHTRFQKGRSGNPSGKRKGTESMKAVVLQVLDQRIPVRRNGKISRLTNRKAIILRELQLAQQGDKAARKTMFDLMFRYDQELADRPVEVDLDDEDNALLDRALARLHSEIDE